MSDSQALTMNTRQLQVWKLLQVGTFYFIVASIKVIFFNGRPKSKIFEKKNVSPTKTLINKRCSA